MRLLFIAGRHSGLPWPLGRWWEGQLGCRRADGSCSLSRPGVAGRSFVRLRSAQTMMLVPSVADALSKRQAGMITTSLKARLRAHVTMLAGNVGERHVLRPEALTAAGDYIISAWREQGYAPVREPFAVDGHACANLIASRPGRIRADEILLIGAYYDTVQGSPGADDNASCVAGLPTSAYPVCQRVSALRRTNCPQLCGKLSRSAADELATAARGKIVWVAAGSRFCPRTVTFCLSKPATRRVAVSPTSSAISLTRSAFAVSWACTSSLSSSTALISGPAQSASSATPRSRSPSGQLWA